MTCIYCSNGNHEIPVTSACDCPCHGQKESSTFLNFSLDSDSVFDYTEMAGQILKKGSDLR